MAAMTGTVMNPSTTTGGNLEKWYAGFEEATYEKMKFIPIFDDAGRPYGLGHIRKKARISGQTLAQSAQGIDLTYASPLGTAITII